MKRLSKIEPCWFCGIVPTLKRKRQGWVYDTMLHVCPAFDAGQEYSVSGDSVEQAIINWNKDVKRMAKEFPEEQQLSLMIF